MWSTGGDETFRGPPMHALTILHRCLCPLISDIHSRRLATLLEALADPVIVADSGFKVPFFREVERLGWRWVGRVPGAITSSSSAGGATSACSNRRPRHRPAWGWGGSASGGRGAHALPTDAARTDPRACTLLARRRTALPWNGRAVSAARTVCRWRDPTLARAGTVFAWGRMAPKLDRDA
jgi:hypothetical protein